MNTKYLTTKEAAQLANVTESQINYARKMHRIENVKAFEPRIKFTEDEVIRFKQTVKEKENKSRTLNFDLTQNYRFLPTCPRVHKCFGNPTKFQSSIIFAVGDGGTIVNVNTMRQMTPYKTGNGHLQVNLQNGYQPEVQTLVGLLHCDNGKLKSIFHHINGKKQDNRAVNLLAVNDDEHKKAHRLFDAITNAKTQEELNAAEIAYQEFIAEVQKDNAETVKEDLRVIDDLDFPGEAYMFVTEDSYQTFLETGNESDLKIRAQYFK